MWPVVLDPLARYALDMEIQIEEVIFATMDWNDDGFVDIAEYSSKECVKIIWNF